jgi:hypothetical protein
MEFKRMKKISGLAVVLSILVAGCSDGSVSKSSPYAGLSNERYSLCIELGSEVMRAMERTGLDSTRHKAAYAKWDSQCSLTALWNVAKEQENGFPSSPKDWADLI